MRIIVYGLDLASTKVLGLLMIFLFTLACCCLLLLNAECRSSVTCDFRLSVYAPARQVSSQNAVSMVTPTHNNTIMMVTPKTQTHTNMSSLVTMETLANRTSHEVTEMSASDTTAEHANNTSIKLEDSGIKYILLYNKFHKKTDYNMGLGDNVFVKHNCAYPRCSLTTDKEIFPSADAVLFHGYVLGFKGNLVPERANPDQIYIYYLFESPLQANQHDWMANLDDKFNLTFTYLDSPETDVIAPYGVIVKRRVPAPEMVPSLASLQEKTGLVAWVVSHCKTKSDRWDYARELSRHISVDIYGKCGNLTCGDDCFDVISGKYLFYLSFENSHCKDYVTEKAFRTLSLNIVPITRGGAEYAKHLPPHSFIDTSDYPAPRVLAELLNRLNANRTEYREYLTWKAEYTIENANYTRGLGFCQLCQILHNNTYPYKHNFDPREYWDPQTFCQHRGHLTY